MVGNQGVGENGVRGFEEPSLTLRITGFGANTKRDRLVERAGLGVLIC